MGDKGKERAPHGAGQSDNKNNSSSNSIAKKDVEGNYYSRLRELKQTFIERYNNAKTPELFLNLPIVLAGNNETTFNFIIGDAGVGKTLLMQTLLKNAIVEDALSEYVVLYFDLENWYSYLKEREIEFFNEYDNFFYITRDILELESERRKIKSIMPISTIYNMLKDIRSSTDKKMLIVIDSLESFILDTIDTEIIKKMFKALRQENVTYIFLHHITKDYNQKASLRFRGSILLKAEADSMLIITDRKKEENKLTYTLGIAKIRAYYETTEITIVFDTDTWAMQRIEKTLPQKEKVVLGVAYKVLKENYKLTKGELVAEIRKRAAIGEKRIRMILEKHEDGFFETEKGEKNTKYYSITTNQAKLDEYFIMLGWGDVSLSETKRQLLEAVKALQLQGYEECSIVKDNIEYKTLTAIKQNIYKMSNDDAEYILERLAIEFEGAET